VAAVALKKKPQLSARCRFALISRPASASEGLTDREHGIVTMFLADVAGIASHGHKLESITEARRTKFREFVARSFVERCPDTCAKIYARTLTSTIPFDEGHRRSTIAGYALFGWRTLP
jgi:hypothetical protein